MFRLPKLPAQVINKSCLQTSFFISHRLCRSHIHPVKYAQYIYKEVLVHPDGYRKI